ncbi:BLUF domain-containing protein [Limnobacter sp.]|uniref:BLUF domain-containing protein n=1 Tax=Limnobacter sp. TaxID=2003368 RepID=UPI00351530AD
MHAIAYVSCASRPLSDDDLEFILLSSRINNEKHGITGVLLHHDSNFLQYIEGEKDSLLAVYNRIKSSNCHRNIFEMLNGPVPQRYFSSWSMGFATVPKTLLLKLEQAKWASQVEDLAGGQAQSDGVGLLLNFWQYSCKV